jgi:hypothetical protein
MRKKIVCFFAMLFLAIALPHISSSNQAGIDSYRVENYSLPESIDYILGTPVGINMLNSIENQGGTIDLDNGKTITLAHAEATLFKGSKSDGTEYDLLWITLDGKASFLFGVETSLNPLDLFNFSIKLHTVSGKTLLIQNRGVNILKNNSCSFQDKDDVTNSIQIEDDIDSLIDTCTILLILGLLSGGILLIVYILVCLL